MNATTNGADYPYLERRAGSKYRQLFIKGTRIRAETAYRRTIPHEDDYMESPEQVAEDFHVPVEAVRDAIRYCESDPVEIRYDDRVSQILDEQFGSRDPDPAKRREPSPLEFFRAQHDAEVRAARELGLQ